MSANPKLRAGSKAASGVWQQIISQIPPHRVLIEAFWGRGAISRKIKRPERIIGIDADRDAVADGDRFADLMFRADALDWLESYFGLRRIPAASRLDASGSEIAPTFPASASADAANGVARSTNEGDHFVYLDPPYLNVPNYYRVEFTEADHRRLCRIFLRLPCPAALSGYRNHLYRDLLSGCRTIDMNTMSRAGPRVETVWFNYPSPPALHDSRFVGRNSRHRERLNRRARTIRRVLRRLHPHERQFLLDAISQPFLENNSANASTGSSACVREH